MVHFPALKCYPISSSPSHNHVFLSYCSLRDISSTPSTELYLHQCPLAWEIGYCPRWQGRCIGLSGFKRAPILDRGTVHQIHPNTYWWWLLTYSRASLYKGCKHRQTKTQAYHSLPYSYSVGPGLPPSLNSEISLFNPATQGHEVDSSTRPNVRWNTDRWAEQTPACALDAGASLEKFSL